MENLDFFQFLWVIFALLYPDPNPATQINADPKPWLDSGEGPLVLIRPHTYIFKLSMAPFITPGMIGLA